MGSRSGDDYDSFLKVNQQMVKEVNRRLASEATRFLFYHEQASLDQDPGRQAAPLPQPDCVAVSRVPQNKASGAATLRAPLTGRAVGRRGTTATTPKAA